MHSSEVLSCDCLSPYVEQFCDVQISVKMKNKPHVKMNSCSEKLLSAIYSVEGRGRGRVALRGQYDTSFPVHAVLEEFCLLREVVITLPSRAVTSSY